VIKKDAENRIQYCIAESHLSLLAARHCRAAPPHKRSHLPTLPHLIINFFPKVWVLACRSERCMSELVKDWVLVPHLFCWLSVSVSLL
jgi:hypothetical protein